LLLRKKRQDRSFPLCLTASRWSDSHAISCHPRSHRSHYLHNWHCDYFGTVVLASTFSQRFNTYAIIPAQSPAKQVRTLVRAISGKGVSADGYPTSFSNEDYSDGTYIHQQSELYRSPKQTNAEMQKHLERCCCNHSTAAVS